MSKPSEADRRHPLDSYPRPKGSSEKALIHGYGMQVDEFDRRRHERRRPPDALERPETAAIDRTGLGHGEPISIGRRAVSGGRKR